MLAKIKNIRKRKKKKLLNEYKLQCFKVSKVIKII